MKMTFGEKIKEARKSKNMTQKQLAERIGAKHNSVSDWENNKNKPDSDTIELLCGVLELTPNYLLTTASTEFSPFERQIIKKYRVLDQHGKEMVDFTLEKEYERSKALSESKQSNIIEIPSYLEANAAHESTGKKFTEEERLEDENMID